MNLILFGPPGAGKGTQSAFLIESLNLKHISTGDLFRAAMKNGTALGIEAKKYMDSGRLVPDSVTIGMVKEVLSGLKGQGFILDGFPRNVAQAEALNALLSDLGLQIDKALFLEVSNKSLIDRLSGRRICRACGAVYHIHLNPPKNGTHCTNCNSSDIYQRPDDQAEAIQTRLVVYDESTKPLKNYYKNSGLLLEIDGTGEVDRVSERLLRAIKV